MSKSKVPLSPFLDIKDAWALAGIINRFAASFDAKKAFSLPEARILFVLLVRAMDVLNRAYPDELKELVDNAQWAKDDDGVEPDDSN
jgi:hypothetical protein